MNFNELELKKELKKGLEECGYTQTTPIQEEAIPYILEGRDLIGQSKTGTGKTASYSLPMLNKIIPTKKEVQAIVLCPTRELATQVLEELRKFNKYQEGVKSIAICGGQPIETQIKAIKSGVQVIVGTPGRIMDHMRRKVLKLGSVSMVVLDEADEMLNMGFEEDIQTILKDVPEKRQTVLFSATMNARIMKITNKYLNSPVTVKIKAQELTVNNIEQISINMKSKGKTDAVMRIIEAYTPNKAIIFCNTKRKVDDLLEQLKSKGYSTEGLHGDIKQSQRERIMRRIKSGDIQILVATDVAARGLDIEGLDLVINYDIPQEEEYYVHRIGRTGRNGEKGKAFTFVVGKEREKINKIQKYAHIKIKEGKIPTLTEIIKVRNKKLITKIQEVIDAKNFTNQELLEELSKNNSQEDIAKALITMLETKTKPETKKVELSNQTGDVTLFLNIGKMDKILAKDIVGSFAANTAISGSDIGRINIRDKFSFADVPAEYAVDIIESMKDKQIKGRDVKIEIAN